MSYSNTQVKLASRPTGEPTPANFTIEATEVPAVRPGQVLVKNQLLSLDPAMRGWMNAGKSYLPPIGIGEVFRALGAGQVVESQHPAFAVGDYVAGGVMAQQYLLSDGAAAADPASPAFLQKIDIQQAPLETYLSTLGMPGMTAYFGLLNTGQPKAGETVVVSAASGAVGSVVGQIAKIKGCRVVGIAGEPEKCAYCVQELGFDACVNYKSADFAQELKAACPEGIDVYFDNVGGDILDLALSMLRLHARVVVCGAISQYNNTTPIKGPANYLSLLMNRARMEGLVVFDNAAHYAEAAHEMAGWLRAGQLQAPKVQTEHGLENFLPALLKLFSGENFGKLVLAV
ncbi:NADP-dependent oxidoreductase [Hymenobacter psoromatis]|nr:NADP-dependent oxidoreductase [Hymenobacter psoromatis]